MSTASRSSSTTATRGSSRKSKRRKSSKERRDKQRHGDEEEQQRVEHRPDKLRRMLEHRIYDRSIVRGLEEMLQKEAIHSEEDVPWMIRMEDSGEAENGSQSSSSKKPQPNDGNVVDGQCTSGQQLSHPPWTYLELRRKQHEQWATQRLEEGVKLAREGHVSRAEARYKEGLDLVPTHAPLLVAYGALCANLGRTQEAIHKLRAALDVDPECPNAKKYLDAIQKTSTTTPKHQAGSVTRSETAMRDVLTERSFLSGKDAVAPSEVHATQDVKYPLVYEETPALEKDNDEGNGSSADDDERRRSHHKHHKKRHHRRDRSRDRHHRRDRSHERHHRRDRSMRKHGRRNRHGSESDDRDSSSDDDSRGRKRHRKERKKRSHRKHHKRHRCNFSDTPDSDKDSSSSSSAALHRRHRKRKHRRRESQRRRRRHARSTSPSPPLWHPEKQVDSHTQREERRNDVPAEEKKST